MSKTYFVTGTDTDVGKTVVSSALMQKAVKLGYNVAGYKPIASGCEWTADGLRNSDALILKSSGSVAVEYDWVNPYAFEPAIAPHFAAKAQGTHIELSVLTQGLTRLQSKANWLLVEGAGGWRVPVDDQLFLSDWVTENKLPVILVVGVKLGCLSHAILTAEAIVRDGLPLVGWVANHVELESAQDQAMIQTLCDHLPCPLLGEIPFIVESLAMHDLSQYVQLPEECV